MRNPYSVVLNIFRRGVKLLAQAANEEQAEKEEIPLVPGLVDFSTEASSAPPRNYFARLSPLITPWWRKIQPYAKYILPALALLFVLTIIYSENRRNYWWTHLAGGISQTGQNVWSRYPNSAVVTILIIMAFILGLNWPKLWQRIKNRPTIYAILLFVILSFVTSFINNWNALVIGSVEISSENETLTQDIVAKQLRGSLNIINIGSADTIPVTAPGPTNRLDEAKRFPGESTFNPEWCPEVMAGPSSFNVTGSEVILAPTEIGTPPAGAVNTGGQDDIQLDTVVGQVNFSLGNIYRFILTFLPNYNRELTVQIIQVPRYDDPNGIRIIVNASDGKIWTVSGPREDLPQLFTFLAYQISQDNNRSQTTEPIAGVDLALTLGNRAFETRDFPVALSYYRITETFRPNDPTTQIMLGLTEYQLGELNQVQEERMKRWQQALRRFQQARHLVPDNTNILVYLGCTHLALGQTETAQARFADFNNSLSPASPLFQGERLFELSKKLPLGVGRDLATYQHESNHFDVYYLADRSIKYTLAHMPAMTLTFSSNTVDTLPPRQIFAVEDGAYFLTTDGLVYFFNPLAATNPIAPVIANDGLIVELKGPQYSGKEKTYTGGISQIFAYHTYLFLVGRLGQIIRLQRSEQGWDTQAVNINLNARQIVLDGDKLYVLIEDGSIWRIADAFGDLQAVELVVSEAQIRDTDTSNGTREIAAFANVIYLLRLNGNIWRYIDREGEQGAALLDAGVQTNSILPLGRDLLVLKNSGQIHRIKQADEPGGPPPEELAPAEAGRLTLGRIGPQLLVLKRGNTSGLTIEEINKDNEALALENISTPTPFSIPTETPTALPTPTFTPIASSTLPRPELASLSTVTTVEPQLDTDDGQAAVAQTTLSLIIPALTITVPSAPTETPLPVETLTETSSLTLAPGPIVTTTITSVPSDLTPAAPLTVTVTLTPTVTPLPPSTEPPVPPESSPPEAEEPPLPAEVPIFDAEGQLLLAVGKTEVTNQQYNACVEQMVCQKQQPGYAPYFYEDNYPVVGVDWEQAQTYCRWVGGSLPTATQWRTVVSPDGRVYPWGNSLPGCDKAVIRGCNPAGESKPEPVGSKPAGASPAGVLDLIGNVWEWTTTPGSGRDNIYLTVGGSWSNPDDSAQGGFENFNPANAPSQGQGYRMNNLGFRCVREQ